MEVISSETAILYQFVPVYVVCIMNFMPKEHEVTKFRTDVALREKSSEKGMDENTIMEITGLTQEEIYLSSTCFIIIYIKMLAQSYGFIFISARVF